MRHYIGADIGGTKMILFFEEDGDYIEERIPTGFQCKKEEIRDALDAFIEKLPCPVDGVGIAVAGLVNDARTELELSDVLPELAGLDAEYLSRGRFPCRFINDVKAAGIAEMSNYPKDNTLAVIMNGTGIAATFCERGQVIQGSRGFAGELGLNAFPSDEGIKTLDELSSGAAVLKRAGLSAQELAYRLSCGDKQAREVISRSAYYFGIALSHIINLYNPDVIITGGGTSFYDGYMETAIRTAEQFTLPELFECTCFERPKDPKRIVALGAREFIRSYLEDKD